MSLGNEVAVGKPQDLRLVQMPILVVFNIFNYCIGFCEPGLTDTADQFVVLAQFYSACTNREKRPSKPMLQDEGFCI